MSDKLSWRVVGVTLCVCFSVVATACKGQVATGAIPVNQAQAAVGLVTKLYTINPLAKADAKGNPLSKQGTWGVRPAKAEERVAECDVEGAVCEEVVYRAGQPEIVCSWTVLFAAGSLPPVVVRDDEASATYMLRKFTKNDRDRPADRPHVPPEMPPIAKVAHMMGRVLLTVVVDASGKIIGVFLVESTNPIFNASAIDAVKRWQMTPYALNGQARLYEQEIQANFM